MRRSGRAWAAYAVHRPFTALLAGAGTALWIEGVRGMALGAATAVAVRFWQHRAAGAQAAQADGRTDGRHRVRTEDAGRMREQVPVAADLLAACLEAGAGPRQAAEAVGRSIGGPLGSALLRVAAELGLGADPAQSWGRLGAEPVTAGLARCMERACGTGAAPVRQVAALAAECRANEVWDAQARARRAGVVATAPLGLCFLPAFLLVGVVPLVVGLASALLAPG